MSKNQLILVLGVFILIIPNLGFSIFIENWILRICGLILLFIFLSSYKKAHSRTETVFKEKITEIYMESSPDEEAESLQKENNVLLSETDDR